MFTVVSAHFVIDSVRKLLDTPTYALPNDIMRIFFNGHNLWRAIN